MKDEITSYTYKYTDRIFFYCSLKHFYILWSDCHQKIQKICVVWLASLTLSVQIHSQVLEDVHVCRVGDGAHWRRAALVVDMCNSLSPYIEHQCIDELEVVAIARLIGYLKWAKQKTYSQNSL